MPLALPIKANGLFAANWWKVTYSPERAKLPTIGFDMKRTIAALIVVFVGMLAGFLPQSSLHAKNVGVTLAPQNEQQKQACDLLIQASRLQKEKKPFQARPLLERAAVMWPQSPHIHFNLGVCYMDTGNFQQSINEYEAALRLDPHLSEAFANIASCYQLMGQPREAISWFQNYLRKNPHAPDADQVRGMMAALDRQALGQIDSNPLDGDYLHSIKCEGRLERWQSARMPLKVYISDGRDQTGAPVRGFREYFNEILLDAFNTWVKASNNRLAYVLVDNAQIADIVCTWTDRKDFLKERGTKVEQGVARVASRSLPQGTDEEIEHVNVIILIMDNDGRNVIADDVMKKACLHETGHALGFAGHSTNNKDIMFFSDSPTVWDSLTKRDRATMARLYQDYPEIASSGTPIYSAPGNAFQRVQPVSQYEQAQIPNATWNGSSQAFPMPPQQQPPTQYNSNWQQQPAQYPSAAN